MANYSYKTKGTCSMEIQFEIEEGIVHNVKFIGGCRGNTQGVSALAEGVKAEELVERLSGIECRNGTSCPDQLAKAVASAIK